MLNILLNILQKPLLNTTLNKDTLRFIFILICFFISLSYGKKNIGRHDAMLLRIGLFFTVCADFCMLILYNNNWGLTFFCLVLLVYMERISAGFQRHLSAIAAYVTALIVSLFGLLIKPAYVRSVPGGFLYHASVFYAVMWIFNLIAVARSFKRKKFPRLNNILIAGGMVMFALCDLFVALYFLELFPRYREIFQGLIWFFYLPSQLLLCLSAVRRTS